MAQTKAQLVTGLSINASAPATALNIDSSGRVLVGTSTAIGGAKLQVYGNATDEPALMQLRYANNNPNSGTTIGQILFVDTNAANGQYATITCAADAGTGSADFPGRLVFSTTADGASSPTERMRLTNNGYLRLGDGTTYYHSIRGGGGNEALEITANAGQQNATTISTIKFLTSDSGGAITERARITGGGEVYIAGTTDQGAYNLQVNGTGVWAQGAYANASDERLKENIESLEEASEVVKNLRPVTFTYKEEFSKDRSTQAGFIAQELQQTLADQAYLDSVVQPGPKYLNVAYQSLIPVLTKALQETMAELETLKAEVAALKGA